ncbi:MAG: assimilatory sulfite reductase (NADPH) flavoprotein subunit [Methylococcales bacterium]
MAIIMTLVPVRTTKQGTSLNTGKLKDAYQAETTTVEIHTDDMAKLGVIKGDHVRLRSLTGEEVNVSCKERKGVDSSPGMIFMAYGPASSALMEGDTAGTGMPLAKHIEVEVEGLSTSEDTMISQNRTNTNLTGQSASPLSMQQTGFLESLVDSSLSPMQAAWLSGYFAALSGQQGQTTLGSQSVIESSTLPLMTIVYGSQTGNGEGLSNRLKEAAVTRGFNVNLMDMIDYEPANIQQESLLFIVVSTHGEGDPPDAAHAFHDYLSKDEAPRLENLKFAVFALGDTSYEKFCQTGKDFDGFLEKLGATRLMERIDADIDFEEQGEEWVGEVLASYQKISEEKGASAPKSGNTVVEFPTQGKKQFSKTNPYPASIIVNTNLNGEGSAKETRHIEIDLGNSGLSYNPGDALGVYPQNNPTYVDELLAALKMDGGQSITVAKESLSLREAFMNRLDMTALSRVLMEKYAKLMDNTDLKTLLDDNHKEEFKDYLWGRQLLDLVEDYPPGEIDPVDLISILRKMPARLYSIASSLEAHKNQVHLLVGAVRYHSFDRDREGVCSTFLAGRVDIGETLSVYVQQNKNFRMPENSDVPIIMVGPGTGLAPFRAFLEERQATGAKGKNWLYFGDQHRKSDYLYASDWDQMLTDGVLTKLDLAFSRDQANKIYVQTLLMENSRETYQWLEEGAYFYVCGDAERMAKDVNQALLDIIAKEGGKSPDQAEVYLESLRVAKRYQRDVY